MPKCELCNRGLGMEAVDAARVLGCPAISWKDWRPQAGQLLA